MQTEPLLATSPQPDIDQALDFLYEVFINDVWHLVAIEPSGMVEARSFGLNKRAEVADWLQAKPGVANCYFYINRLKFGATNPITTKADIKYAAFCHVEVKRTDPITLGRIQTFRPAPSIILNDGHSCYALWHLDRMTRNFDRVERINRALANQLGGGGHVEVNAMMPLPGTIALPRTGEPALVEIVEDYLPISKFKNSPSYQLDDFPETQAKTFAPVVIPSNQNTGPDELNALVDKLPDKLRELILHGDDPDYPLGNPDARFQNESEIVWKAVTDLTLLNSNPSIIAGLLQNSQFGISQTILAKRNPKQYAIKLVQEASEAVNAGWRDIYKDGRPKPSMQNALSAPIRLGVDFEYDTFNNRKWFMTGNDSTIKTELSEDGCASLRKFIIDRLGFDPSKGHVSDAANILCLENSFHPIIDKLDALKWDGESGLDRMLSDYFGADATPYTQAVSRHIMLSAIRRLRQPGIKQDNLVVLEGDSGSDLSAALEVLAGGDNYCDQDIVALDHQTQMKAVEGIWLYELNQLDGLTRVEAAKANAFIVRREDQVRPTGPQNMPHRPRQCTFVATTHMDGILKEQIGRLQLLPVQTGEIDLDGLLQERDQLWAEAAYLERQQTDLIFPDDLRPDEYQNRTQPDPWLNKLKTVKGVRMEEDYRISTQKLMEAHLEIEDGHLHAYYPKRLARSMRRLGWTGPKKYRLANGKTTRGYERFASDGE